MLSARQWLHCTAERLATFGIVINTNRPRLPRYREIIDADGLDDV
jgi:hypothetical protein